MTNEEAIAQRYAQAIFELGVETSTLTSLIDQIRLVAEAYASSAELRTTASHPLLADQAREAVMRNIGEQLGLAPLALNTIALLTRRRRLFALPLIAAELSRMADERAGIVRATVTSAAPLSEAYYHRLQSALERSISKRVVLERKIDPSLLAGVVTRIGDRVLDGSAKARLAALRAQLLAS
jgi:F-type H+-transporting ATPase subunit delta